MYNFHTYNSDIEQKYKSASPYPKNQIKVEPFPDHLKDVVNKERGLILKVLVYVSLQMF